jgi:Putative zinc-finger
MWGELTVSVTDAADRPAEEADLVAQKVSMTYDAQHALEHPEVAGWALSALDPDDAAALEEHLKSCEQCQAEATEFAPVARSLVLAAPAAEPPPDLELKIMAAVQYAVMTESPEQSEPRREPASPKPDPESKARRWWHLHWTNPLLPVVTALGAAAVTGAAFIGVHAFQAAAPAHLRGHGNHRGAGQHGRSARQGHRQRHRPEPPRGRLIRPWNCRRPAVLLSAAQGVCIVP